METRSVPPPFIDLLLSAVVSPSWILDNQDSFLTSMAALQLTEPVRGAAQEAARGIGR
jgi:hypothetical protein